MTGGVADHLTEALDDLGDARDLTADRVEPLDLDRDVALTRQRVDVSLQQLGLVQDHRERVVGCRPRRAGCRGPSEILHKSLAVNAGLALFATKRHVNAVTGQMVGIDRSWSDADGLVTALSDPECADARKRYLERRRER